MKPAWFVALVLAGLLAGCEGPQSALEPAGEGAERIANLFWWMLGGGACVWLIMIALAVHSIRSFAEGPAVRRTRLLIIGGGTVLPTIVLTTLLLYSLPMLPELLARPPDDALRIDVHGKMWWWRVSYPGDDPQNENQQTDDEQGNAGQSDGELGGSGQSDAAQQSSVELANEIRLPVGEPVEFRLTSDDVIHAFWIPSLGGKVDMFPGRETRLTLHPTKTGVFRGACAEYCGASHALMNFDVIVMERGEFDEWLAQQRQPARLPTSETACRGQQLFLQSGCHACHAVRGVSERGVIGPDLTHVGSRHTIGASILPNDANHFSRWIADVDAIKPGVRMPHFKMLPEADRSAIAAFLEELQ